MKACFLAIVMMLFCFTDTASAKEKIHALYIPLADHYAAAVVAHARYRSEMKHCDYSVQMMKSWPALRGKFTADQADAAFIICPMALDMFAENPDFRFVSLVHRDGNALAVNSVLSARIKLAEKRIDRKPLPDTALAMSDWKKETGITSICAVPSLLATHTVVLYKYLKDHGVTMSVGKGEADVMARAVPPPKSPDFLQLQAESGKAASFEQSLPWADVVETGGYGKITWYSKDVIPWKHGHVECIMIAKDSTIRDKKEALRELIYYIHKAGRDIDSAREAGGDALQNIAELISTYIPLHKPEVIVQSLRSDLNVINYSNLNTDKPGLELIMNLALEGGILKKRVSLDDFTDESFSTDITKTDVPFPQDTSETPDSRPLSDIKEEE
ncbi:MAG: ABC transporter substrate-binding protein [Desulfococcaceae bacterium]